MNPLAKIRSWLRGVTAAGPALQPDDVATAPLFRVIAPEARDRWQGAAVRAYTPQYVEQITRGAMSGHLQAQWEMFDLMEQTWPRLNSALNDLKDAVLGLKRSCNPIKPSAAFPDYGSLVVGMTQFCNAFAKVKPNLAAINAFIRGHAPGHSGFRRQRHRRPGNRLAGQGHRGRPRAGSALHPLGASALLRLSHLWPRCPDARRDAIGVKSFKR